MKSVHQILHLFALGCVVALVLPHQAFGQVKSKLSVTAVRTDGKSYFGQLVERNDKQITLLDASTNDLISIKMSQVTGVEENYPHKSMQLRMGLPKYFAWRIASANNLGLIRGRIALVDPDGIFVSLGANQGIKSGSELVVRGSGKTITHPETGEVLRVVRPEVAKLQVTRVFGEKLCQAALTDPSQLAAVKKGMVVDWQQSDRKLAVLPVQWQGKVATAKGNEAIQVQNALIDALVARGVTVVSNAQIDSTALRLSQALGLSKSDIPSLDLAKGVNADIAVTGAIIAKSNKAAEMRLRVMDAKNGNFVDSAEGIIRLRELGGNNQAMQDRTRNKPANKVPGKTNVAVNFLGMKFKRIPAGKFMMGKPGSQHLVTISKSFEIGIFEVTQQEYFEVTGEKPSHFNGLNNPVEGITWFEAVDFCKRLTNHPKSKAAGYVYRLPTEAEWEHACRAGTTTLYSFGDKASDLDAYAVNKNNSRSTKPVGTKKPNPWGLYDMHGNVWEWCLDWYEDYPRGPVTDPTGRASGSLRTPKIRRGGCFASDASRCLSRDRGLRGPANRDYNCGIRLVRIKTN